MRLLIIDRNIACMEACCPHSITTEVKKIQQLAEIAAKT
jgi:hypothetical protein